MKKFVSALFLAVLLVSSTAAVENYDGNQDQPHITAAPSDQAPDVQPGPDNNRSLPDQAVDGIGKAISNVPGQAVEVLEGVANHSGEALGNFLQGLLGEGSGNETPE